MNNGSELLTQPLLTSTDHTEHDEDIKQNLSETESSKSHPSRSLSAVGLLPLSNHLQAGLTAADDDQDSVMDQYLVSLGVTHQHLEEAQVPMAPLLRLYQKEFSWMSWLKWSSLDHAVEKYLQWPLLSPDDIASGITRHCDYRVRPRERSILLQRPWGLMKAYAVRGLVQGLEMGLLMSTHYFIYAMLAYRLEELVRTGQAGFQEIQDVFSGSNQKGIDSLVLGLARLDAAWLKLILSAPLLLGSVRGLQAMWGAWPVTTADIKRIANSINAHLAIPGSFWRNAVLEEVPLLSNLFSLGRRVQTLERWVRWDGRLDRESRQQAFELIRRVAREAKYISQIIALESLGKIAHGVGLKDLLRLQRAGWTSEDLAHLLYIKATALADLEAMSQPGSSVKAGKATILFRRLYAYYLLWWLGQATSWFAQRLPFTVLKTVKLGIEAIFLQKIIASVLEALRCPDKPGFRFGNGYEDWASDYTAECFTARVSFLRTIDVNESIAAFVTEISQYHLTELTTLDLSRKYLTSQEALQIIQAVTQQGTSLQTLYLSNNYLSVLNDEMFNGLSQLTYLSLVSNQIKVLSEDTFSGLSRLTYLSLTSNQISVLSEGVFSRLSQLTTLSLVSNPIAVLTGGMFRGLSQLTSLDLTNIRISVLNASMFSELSQLTFLAVRSNPISVLSEGVFSRLSQLTTLYLTANQIRVLSNGVFNGLSQLTALDLDVNQISTLANGLFSSLSQLTSLDLSNNYINALSADVFRGLTQLTYLSLWGNQISVLGNGVFSGLSQLQTLDLLANKLNTNSILGMLLPLPATLTELNIASNQISALPQNFSALLPVNLKSLSIGNNAFIPRVLTHEFMQYFPSQLTRFSIQSSNIANIMDGSFADFFVLTTLYLTGNRLSVLREGMFSGLSQLTSLDLGYSQISNLTEKVFSGLSQLTTLQLSGNQISALNGSVFSELSQLTYLNLFNNRISALRGGVFSGLSQLVTLYLYNNQINTINDGVFSGLSRLKSLSLSTNQISVFSESLFSELSQLISLSLDRNRISVLGEGTFSGLSQLVSLNLADNQLNDSAIKNLTQNFPYQLKTLDVRNNQIGNDGALALAEMLPCTNFTVIYITGNPANDTAMAVARQQAALQKVCDDRLCHTNLPPAKSCGGSQKVTTATHGQWETSHSFAVDGPTTEALMPFYWSDPANDPSLQSPLALDSPTFQSALSTPLETGGIILGMASLILLYKHNALVKNIINAGSGLLQSCWRSSAVSIAAPSVLSALSSYRCCFFKSLPAQEKQSRVPGAPTASLVL